MSLTIASLNLLFDLTDWDKRAQLVLESFRELQADVITLQEVSAEADNAHWLATALGGYSVHLCPAREHPASDNLAILSRLPARDHEILALAGEGRQAHRVVVAQGDTRWTIGNTHLYWNPLGEYIRVGQAYALLDWLRDRSPAILCGDFNARPQSKSQRVLQTRFSSAFRTANGRDPEYTYPTPLKRRPGMRHVARDAFFRANGWVRTGQNVHWRQTVDHIFVDEAVRVEECRIICDRPSPTDPLLYPSDHLGLFASLSTTP